MAERSTRDALLEQGALLFARRGVAGVTAKELHAAAGARNTSALHYHFGDQEGLVAAIITLHVDAIEERRARLVAEIEASDASGDLRALVRALAAPMADDLHTPLGRAHLRLVAQVSHPSLAYGPAFKVSDAPAGSQVVRWLAAALPDLPEAIRRERLVALRAQLIGLFAFRATLRDTSPEIGMVGTDGLFLENLVDLLVAGLQAPPSSEAVEAERAERRRHRS
ncbi:MAG TPA: TetR/AcrR family transcriptional regulator [Iamia sp.]